MTFVIAGILSLIVARWRSNRVLWLVLIIALFNSLAHTQQSWGVYHYYIGAKYFTELGYTDLYECSTHIPAHRRDLHTYDFRNDPPRCPARFAPARWFDFLHDLNHVGFEPRFMVDKGMNATPAWIALAQVLINLGIDLDLLLLIDPLTLVLACLALWWLVGTRQILMVAIIILLFMGTLDRLWGHFAQWTWLALLLPGIALLEHKKTWGGVLIGIASGLMIFPAFALLRYRSLRVWLWALAGLSLTLGIGLFNSRGMDGYIDFIHNMSTHSAYIRTEGCCNYGLANTIARSGSDSDYVVSCFAADVPNCDPQYPDDLPGWWIILIPMVTFSPFGLMYALLTLSRYYYLILAVIPLWHDERGFSFLMVVNTLMIATRILMPHDALNVWVFAMFFVLWGVFGESDPSRRGVFPVHRLVHRCVVWVRRISLSG